MLSPILSQRLSSAGPGLLPTVTSCRHPSHAQRLLQQAVGTRARRARKPMWSAGNPGPKPATRAIQIVHGSDAADHNAQALRIREDHVIESAAEKQRPGRDAGKPAMKVDRRLLDR